MVEASIELGIETLVVYAFSTENWSRPTDEVADLMELLSETIDEELPDLAKQGVRTRFLGRRDRIEPWLEHKMRSLEEQTAHLDTLHLWIAFDYGGRAEIAHAARRLVEDGLEPAQVDEDALAARLYAPELGDVDLLIRTSGELRISNFLLWEAAYAELVFTDTLWPDFDVVRSARGRRRLRGAPAGASGPVPRREPVRVADRRGGRAAAARPRDRLARGLVALRPRSRRRAPGAARALRDLPRPQADRARPATRASSSRSSAPSSGARRGCSPGILATLPAALLVFFVSSARQSAVAGFAMTLLGVGWVGGGLAYLVLLRDIPADGRLLIYTTLLTVFADDTAAFFVGRTIGRHRLAPAISPGKSWEGFVGGTVAAVAVAFFALYEQDVVTTGESLVLGLAIALAATLGDLFESAVKRDLGVKDSGRLLAGHGGVLDRVDSLLWAGPAAYVTLLALT